MTTDSLEVIRRRINMGDREGAKLALLDLLKTDPDNSEAWALLAILLPEPIQQAECYRQILRIDPENRQAALWLEALSRQLPDSSPETEHPRSADAVLIELGGHPSPAGPPGLGSDELDRLLGQSDLSHLDPETRLLASLGLPTVPSGQGALSPEVQAHEKGLLDRLASRLTGDPLGSRALAGTTSRRGATPRSRPLTPEEIIELAGGPLSPEERRKCPKCGAVVSRSEIKCPWCSEPLSSGEAG